MFVMAPAPRRSALPTAALRCGTSRNRERLCPVSSEIQAELLLEADLLDYGVMAADPRARELLELMSRTIEANPGADARTLRVRAGVKRVIGDKALELLERAGFIERKQISAQDTYRSLKPYRASIEAPRTAFAKTHSVREGGT